MAEYIEREAAINAVYEAYADGESAYDALENLPAADVRPVVLCKDCMYCQKDENGRWCFNDYENELRDDDFCSRGKRKEKQT